jgi:hypothetical protein
VATSTSKKETSGEASQIETIGNKIEREYGVRATYNGAGMSKEGAVRGLRRPPPSLVCLEAVAVPAGSSLRLTAATASAMNMI